MKTTKSKLNWKGRMVKVIAGNEAWFRMGQLIKSYSGYIKDNVIDIGGETGKYRRLILGIAGVTNYTNLDLLEGADIVADLNKSLPIKDN